MWLVVRSCRPARFSRLAAVALVSGLVATLCTRSASAGAEDWVFLVPRVMIYPGDTVSDGMIEERRYPPRGDIVGFVGARRGQVNCRVARRSLLPGQLIPLNALREPDVVRAGKPVTLVFATGGLSITARGLAMQSGVAGDVVSVQNADSNIVVRGRVQGDGAVRVED